MTDLPLEIRALAERGAKVVRPKSAAELGVVTRSTLDLCREALERPLAMPPLGSLIGPRSKVAVLVSDATRDEPRNQMFEAVRQSLSSTADSAITIVIASGTHAPRPADTALAPDLLWRYRVVVHQGDDVASCVDLGTTPEGTRVRVNRAVVEADLVVSLGRVRPHYFAGYSGGVKGIFPGAGHTPDIRQNHLLKADPTARLGRLDDNRCRLDMEAAAALVPGRKFLLNVVTDCDNAAVDAVAGDIVLAHRQAAERALSWFRVDAPSTHLVVTSDRPPVTSSLYQAAKLLPPAGAILENGGTAVLLADCSEGTGPLEVVNRGIYELGVRPAMPKEHVVRLVSGLTAETAARTFALPAESVSAALAASGIDPEGSLDAVVVLWRAAEMIPIRANF